MMADSSAAETVGERVAERVEMKADSMEYS